MKLKTVAIATMAVTLSGASAIALTQVTTASPAAAPSERGQRDLVLVGSRGEGRRHGRRGQRGPSEMMRKVMREADTNDDRALSQDEIDTFIVTKVEGADADGDGGLTIEEFEVIYRDLTRNRMVDAFQRLDEDGTGIITAEEIDERFGDVVARMDRNGDGVLSRDDRRRGRHGKRERRGNRDHRTQNETAQ